jgi:2,3-dihydroxybenzoate-AMP ligase
MSTMTDAAVSPAEIPGPAPAGATYDGVWTLVPYPPELLARHDELLGDRTIAEEFSAVAAAHADAVALITPEGTRTYRELDELSDRVAVGLRDLGLNPGERVLMQFTNSGWAVVSWYALLKAGLVPVATLAQHREHELYEIAEQCQPAAHLIEADFPGQDLVALATGTAARTASLRVLLTVGAVEPPAGAVAVEDLSDSGPADPAAVRRLIDRIQAGITPTNIACLQLSGGTTSTPKLIPRRHAEYWLNARLYAEGMDVRPGDFIPHLLPVIHNAGVVCGLHTAHSQGAAFGTCAATADAFTQLVRHASPSHLMMPPPVRGMIDSVPELKERLQTLRLVIWVLGKLPADAIEEWETGGRIVGQMFGQSEGLCMITPLDAPAEIRHGTVGRPLCELDEVRILIPETETEAPEGEAGELCCRGPYTIRGYYLSPARNATAFTSDGFYRTGDIVRRIDSPDGPSYALEDRIKDLINRGGEKVNAQEVEKLLLDHPAIFEVALVAMPDPRLGERACAFVVTAEGAEAPDKADLAGFLDGRGVAKYKWPERIEIRDRLPRTNVQKIDKKQLRAEINALLEGGR